jgi:hypothetical protein
MIAEVKLERIKIKDKKLFDKGKKKNFWTFHIMKLGYKDIGL